MPAKMGGLTGLQGITFSLGLATREFLEPLRQAGQELRNFATNSANVIAATNKLAAVQQQAFNTAQKKAEEVEKAHLRQQAAIQTHLNQLNVLGNKMRFMGAAIVTFWTTMAIKISDATHAVWQLSIRTGTAVEDLSKLAFMSEITGSSFEQMDRALKVLGMRIHLASEGYTQINRAFNLLGISVQNADGSLRSMYDVLVDMSDAFAGLENQTLKMAVASQILGWRSGPTLLNLLQQGADGIRIWGETLERYGAVITKEQAMAMDDLKAKLTTFKHAVMGLIREALGPLQEAIEPVLNLIMRATKGIIEWSKSNQGAFRILVLLTVAMGPLLIVGGQMLTMFNSLVNITGTLTGSLAGATGGFKGLIAMAGAAAPVILGVVAAIGVLVAALYLLYDRLRRVGDASKEFYDTLERVAETKNIELIAATFLDVGEHIKESLTYLDKFYNRLKMFMTHQTHGLLGRVYVPRYLESLEEVLILIGRQVQLVKEDFFDLGDAIGKSMEDTQKINNLAGSFAELSNQLESAKKRMEEVELIILALSTETGHLIGFDGIVKDAAEYQKELDSLKELVSEIGPELEEVNAQLEELGFSTKKVTQDITSMVKSQMVALLDSYAAGEETLEKTIELLRELHETAHAVSGELANVVEDAMKGLEQKVADILENIRGQLKTTRFYVDFGIINTDQEVAYLERLLKETELTADAIGLIQDRILQSYLNTYREAVRAGEQAQNQIQGQEEELVKAAEKRAEDIIRLEERMSKQRIDMANRMREQYNLVLQRGRFEEGAEAEEFMLARLSDYFSVIESLEEDHVERRSRLLEQSQEERLRSETYFQDEWTSVTGQGLTKHVQMYNKFLDDGTSKFQESAIAQLAIQSRFFDQMDKYYQDLYNLEKQYQADRKRLEEERATRLESASFKSQAVEALFPYRELTSLQGMSNEQLAKALVLMKEAGAVQRESYGKSNYYERERIAGLQRWQTEIQATSKLESAIKLASELLDEGELNELDSRFEEATQKVEANIKDFTEALENELRVSAKLVKEGVEQISIEANQELIKIENVFVERTSGIVSAITNFREEIASAASQIEAAVQDAVRYIEVPEQFTMRFEVEVDFSNLIEAENRIRQFMDLSRLFQDAENAVGGVEGATQGLNDELRDLRSSGENLSLLGGSAEGLDRSIQGAYQSLRLLSELPDGVGLPMLTQALADSSANVDTFEDSLRDLRSELNQTRSEVSTLDYSVRALDRALSNLATRRVKVPVEVAFSAPGALGAALGAAGAQGFGASNN